MYSCPRDCLLYYSVCINKYLKLTQRVFLSGAPVAPPDVGWGTTGGLTSVGTLTGSFSTFGLAGLEPPLVPCLCLIFPSFLTFVYDFARGSVGTPLCRLLALTWALDRAAAT